MFGVDNPHHLGHCWQVTTANGVGLDFASTTDPIASQHYALLVSEADFDNIYERIVERGLSHWADPTQRHPHEINNHDGGRGGSLSRPGSSWNEPEPRRSTPRDGQRTAA